MENLLISIKICKLFVIVVDQIDDLKGLFYFEASFQFAYDTFFIVIFNDENVDEKEAMKSVILKDSHFLAILKPIGSNYSAYRSTFLNENFIEMYLYFLTQYDYYKPGKIGNWNVN